MKRDESGWKRASRMRQWRDRRGGLKAPDPGAERSRLEHCLDAWLAKQKRDGLAAATRATRAGLVRQFLRWCRKRDVVDPEWISVGLIEEWRRWLDEYRTRWNRPLSDSTRVGLVAAVRTFLEFLRESHVLDSNPLAFHASRRPPAQSLPHVLDEDQVAAVLAAPKVADLLGIRDRAILELFYSSGLRRTEMSQLEVGDLQLKRGVVRVRHGKGGKARMVPIGRVARFWLKRYLKEARPKFVVEGEGSSAVFLTGYGSGFAPGSLGLLVRHYFERVGLEVPGACHLLRHACATHMLDHGSDLRTIQSLLGHSRLDTTEIYTHVTTERMQGVHRDCHPRG